MPHVRLLTLSALVAAATVPSAAQAQLSLPKTGVQTISLKPDLVALIDRTTVQLKFTTVSMRTAASGATSVPRPTVPMTVCSGLEVGQRRAVNVPPMRWGVRAASFKTSNGSEVRGPGSQFVVRLTYKTVTGGLVAEQVVNETVASLAPGAEQFFAFTHPSRPTTYTVEKFEEPKKPETTTTTSSGGTSMRVGSPSIGSSLPRTFCIPSIDAVDHAITVNVDPDSRTGDLDRTNNLLRIP